MSEEKFMRQAIKLALRGRGRTSPNPLVGAVVVNDAGEIVGQGYHQEAGGPHAEINALNQAGEKARGASLYVNLEPCCHFGRTPPCTDAIIARGIKKVVSAHADPNLRVRGQGFMKLKHAGIEVETGLLEAKARAINEAFIKYITTGLPFVSLKTAVTLDGKTAVKTGESRWITGVKARKYVHWLRDGVDALLTGIGTVRQDDPLLTTRIKRGGQDPVRVIVDSRGSIDLGARVFNAESCAATIIAVTEKAPISKLKRLQEKGAEVVVLNGKDGRVDLKGLLEALGKRHIISIMAEAGGTLNYALLEAGLVDKLYCFIAPVIFGGRTANTSFEGEGIAAIDDAWRLKETEIKRVGADILVTGYLQGRGVP